MKNLIHISISITTYSYASPSIFYYENIHGRKYSTSKLSYNEACRRMWELRKLGGEKTISTNELNPAISTREVTLWDWD